jgi:ribonuclease T1
MAARRGGWGTWLPVVAGVAATVLTLYFFTTPADQGDEPYSPPTTTASVPGGSASTAGTGATDPVSGLAWVDLAALPPEAADTVDLIDAGGPFPYDEDDGTFGNFEGVLPDQPRGYYREYTVETPGSNDRGARRIVAGSEGELYWTADHYQSFERIRR